MSNLKRQYLTSEEKNFYFISKAFLQYIEGSRSLECKQTYRKVWEVWKEHGMIAGDMQKNLKMSYSYLRKFCIELESNLSKAEIERLNKQLMKFDYKLIDDYTVKKLLRDIKDNMKYAVIEREKFYPVIDDIASVRCVGCKENYEKCAIYKMFYDMSIPYVKEEPNCPYACNLSEFSEDELKNIEKMKKRIKERRSAR